MSDIDWSVLREQALAAAGRAYAPYSNFRVGAAAVTDSGTIITGCNVENASYGVTLCAECGIVSALVDSGSKRLTAITVRHHDGDTLVPCGRCRQLLAEVGGTETLVDTPDGPRPLHELLPDAFTASDLDKRE